MMSKRKGFTLVEMVIVIAIIGVMAAVLIPTFASVANEADKTADRQLMSEVNAKLTCGEIGKADIQNYVLRSKGWQFAYSEEYNEVVIADEQGKIVAAWDANKEGTEIAGTSYEIVKGSEKAWWELIEPTSDLSGITNENCPEEVRISDDVSALNGKFEGMTKLKRIYLGKQITEIPTSEFQGCSSLTEVIIGGDEITIGDYAFDGCTVLSKIEFGKVKSIGEHSFAKCTALKEVNISNCKEIAYGSFYKCELDLLTMGLVDIKDSAAVEINTKVKELIIDGQGNEIQSRFTSYLLQLTKENSAVIKKITVSNVTAGRNEKPFRLLTQDTEIVITDEASYNSLVAAAKSESDAFGSAKVVKQWAGA